MPDEFDDKINLIIHKDKSKIFVMDNKNITAIPKNVIDLYEYILSTRVYSPVNSKEFKSKVRATYIEIQHEFCDSMSDFFLPSCEMIAERIDDENDSIIRLFLEQYENVTEEQIESIVSMYINEVSFILPEAVKYLLDIDGFPYLNSENTISLHCDKILTLQKFSPEQVFIIKSLI